MPITVSGTSITFNDATVQTTAGGSGTVTSVATGNGLQGGTITSSGTLSVACPSWGSVGSYIWAYTNGLNPNAGGNYPGGTGGSNGTIGPGRGNGGGACGAVIPDADGSLSGTWKWMAANAGNNTNKLGLACRVS